MSEMLWVFDQKISRVEKKGGINYPDFKYIIGALVTMHGITRTEIEYGEDVRELIQEMADRINIVKYGKTAPPIVG